MSVFACFLKHRWFTAAVLSLGLAFAALIALRLYASWLIDSQPLQQPSANGLRLASNSAPLAYVRLGHVSPWLRTAIISVEDHRFYEHHGIDWLRTAKVVSDWAIHGVEPRGTSTVTQQLARTLYLSPGRSWRRKILEAAVALELERRWSKDQILERYLNYVPTGQGLVGVAEAADRFFHKNPAALSLAEASLIAGTIQCPGHLDPRVYPRAAVIRRNRVLIAMSKAGIIGPQALLQAAFTPLDVRPARNPAVPLLVNPHLARPIQRASAALDSRYKLYFAVLAHGFQ